MDYANSYKDLDDNKVLIRKRLRQNMIKAKIIFIVLNKDNMYYLKNNQTNYMNM